MKLIAYHSRMLLFLFACKWHRRSPISKLSPFLPTWSRWWKNIGTAQAGKEAASETAVGCGSIFHSHRILLIKHHYLSLSLGRHSTIRLSLGVDLDWSKRTYLNCRSPVSQIPPMLSQDLVLCVFVQTRRRRSVRGAYLTGFFSSLETLWDGYIKHQEQLNFELSIIWILVQQIDWHIWLCLCCLAR